MRVNIDEIKEAGIERSWDLSRQQLDEVLEGDRAGYQARQAAHVEARLEKLGRRIRLAARTRAELSCPCGRCLEAMALAVPVDFQLTLVPVERQEAGAAGDEKGDDGRSHLAGSFDPDEADEELITGKVLDLDAMVREQILLALPPYPVCRESCKGLCPACGANLNDRDCGCDRRVPDPRWDALRKLRQQ
jgi:uncharacterized protein